MKFVERVRSGEITNPRQWLNDAMLYRTIIPGLQTWNMWDWLGISKKEWYDYMFTEKDFWSKENQ